MLRYYIKDYIFGIVFLSFICARMLVVRYMQYFFRGIEMSALLRHIYHIHNFFFGPMACQLVIRRWANADLLSLFSEGADCSSVWRVGAHHHWLVLLRSTGSDLAWIWSQSHVLRNLIKLLNERRRNGSERDLTHWLLGYHHHRHGHDQHHNSTIQSWVCNGWYMIHEEDGVLLENYFPMKIDRT